MRCPSSESRDADVDRRLRSWEYDRTAIESNGRVPSREKTRIQVDRIGSSQGLPMDVS